MTIGSKPKEEVGEDEPTSPASEGGAGQEGSGRDEARQGDLSKVWPYVLLVSLMFLLTYLDRAMFGPLLPDLEAEFGITHAASTRFLLYISIGYSAGMFLSCFSSSKVRPRVMVSASLLGCGLALLGIAEAGSTALLSLFFALLGLAASQYFNGGMSTMRSLVRPAEWSKAISIHEIGPSASFFLGPLLAEAGAALLGWRGVAAGMGLVSILAGFLFYWLAKGGDTPAAPVSFKGVKAVLREPKLWLFTWLMGIAVAGEFAPFSVLSLHMTLERGMSPETTALLLSISRGAGPFAVLGGGFITARFGARRTMVVCFGLYALGMFLLAVPWTVPFVFGLCLQPLMVAMSFPPIFTMLAESFPVQSQTLLLAVGMPISALMGVGLMPSLLGLWGDYASFSAGFVMLGCLAAASLPLLRAPGPKV
jgi:NNP family nitrate/nitrite transporter-like MFS transporter